MTAESEHHVCGVCGTPANESGQCSACGAPDMMLRVRNGYVAEFPPGAFRVPGAGPKTDR